MIAYLKGKIISRSKDYIILENKGIGFKIEMGNVSSLHNKTAVTLYIHTHVRENELRLFGFLDDDDLKIFEMLLDISGVGPKVALVLIAELGSKGVIQAVLAKQSENLKVPGVGLKTADKIILELYDKLHKEGYTLGNKGRAKDIVMTKENKEKVNEAAMALKSLGYSNKDIVRIRKDISQEKINKMGVEEIVKYLLSLLK